MQTCEAIETKVQCSCGVSVVDYEAWIRHVRERIPLPARQGKPNYKRQQQERERLLAYIDRHRIVNGGPKFKDEEN